MGRGCKERYGVKRKNCWPREWFWALHLLLSHVRDAKDGRRRVSWTWIRDATDFFSKLLLLSLLLGFQAGPAMSGDAMKSRGGDVTNGRTNLIGALSETEDTALKTNTP